MVLLLVKKVPIEAKIDSSLTFMIISFFNANSTSTKTLILYVFCHKYMEEKNYNTWDINLCSNRGRKKIPPGLFQLVSIPKQLQQSLSCYGLHVTTAESNHLNNFQQG